MHRLETQMPKNIRKRFRNNGLGMLFVFYFRKREKTFVHLLKIPFLISLQFSMCATLSFGCKMLKNLFVRKTFLCSRRVEFLGLRRNYPIWSIANLEHVKALFIAREMFIFSGTICVQHSCVHSNLFYCSDSVDLAERDAQPLLLLFILLLLLLLFLFFFLSFEFIWKVP